VAVLGRTDESNFDESNFDESNFDESNFDESNLGNRRPARQIGLSSGLSPVWSTTADRAPWRAWRRARGCGPLIPLVDGEHADVESCPERTMVTGSVGAMMRRRAG